MVEGEGYVCKRGDELGRSPMIHKSIFDAVLNSDLMIADLTFSNPNVLYELGIRHGLRSRATVLICGSGGARLPFDVAALWTILYRLEDDEPGEENFQRQLRRALSETDGIHVNDSPVHEFFPDLRVNLPRAPCVFIGHGRSALWARLQLMIEKNLKLPTITFESDPHAGESVVPVLENMLSRATFAVLVMTAEDETALGSMRARQNVVHEAGLFQGVLGFRRAIVLREEGVEQLSNLAGLQYIEFRPGRIEDTFFELQRVFLREELLTEAPA